MGKLVDLTRRPRPSRGPGEAGPAALPLVPCNAGPAPSWRIERLSEDRFRLTIAAAGLAPGDVEVFIAGGLLHVEGAAGAPRGRALACMFLLLEPLSITRVELRDGELVIELERDPAWPCLAVPPPVRREGVAALALAA